MNRSRRGPAAPRASRQDRTEGHRHRRGCRAARRLYGVRRRDSTGRDGVRRDCRSAHGGNTGPRRHGVEGQRAAPVTASTLASTLSASGLTALRDGLGVAVRVARRDERRRRSRGRPNPDARADSVVTDRYPVARPHRPIPVGIGPAVALTVRRADQHSPGPDAGCRRPGASPTHPARPGSRTTQRSPRPAAGNRRWPVRRRTGCPPPGASRGSRRPRPPRPWPSRCEPAAERADHSDRRAVALRRRVDHVRVRGQRVDHREGASTAVVALPPRQDPRDASMWGVALA